MIEYLQILGYGFAFAMVTMLVFWSWGRKLDNYGVIDVGWGIVNMGLVWVYFLSGFAFPNKMDVKSLLDSIPILFLLGMITIWGLRLAIFLYWTRILPGHPEDKRYNAFRKDYGDQVHRKFFTNVFVFQGLIALVLTAPFVPIFLVDRIDPGVFTWMGLGFYILGQMGETLSDSQLSGFVANSANKGQVCNVGLWKYSRHPNYFFEWMIWLGMSLVVVEANAFGIIPAIIMYLLLVYGTGIPFAEKYSLMSKGDKYREYQRTTSAFFPWFPKK